VAIKKNEHAIKAFKKAIKISPNYVDFYNNLGNAYLKIGACRNAVQQFNVAINQNNYYAEAYFNKGLAYVLNQLKKDDFELTANYRKEVKICFDKAILMNPSYQNKHFAKGLEYIEADKPLEAMEELQLAKEEGIYYSYLFDKYDYFLKILFCSNEDESYELVWNYIHFLKELLKKYPGHADVYNDLGLAYCMLRNYMNDKAIVHFDNALKINPNFKNAKRNFKLSHYEKVGSELFLEALTLKRHENGLETNEDKLKDLIIEQQPVNRNSEIEDPTKEEHYADNFDEAFNINDNILSNFDYDDNMEEELL
jgi:tetratricopeptide (TPR) repeat protein